LVGVFWAVECAAGRYQVLAPLALLQVEGVGSKIDISPAFVALPVAAHLHMRIQVHLFYQQAAALAFNFGLAAAEQQVLFESFGQLIPAVLADLVFFFYVLAKGLIGAKC
jgi:hypothetical protein